MNINHQSIKNWTSVDTIDKDGFYRHHECGCILLRVNKNTYMTNCYCYCKKCRKEIKLENVINGKIVIVDSQQSKETA